MNRLTCIGLIPALLLAGGCAANRVNPPEGYLEIENPGQYEQRFVSARHNAFAYRTVANPKGGTAEFWKDAIKQELVDLSGYQLKDATSIKAGRLDGTLFDFRTSIDKIEHTYLLAMFVDGQTIHLIEAGGQSELVATDRKKLEAAMQSLHAGL